MTVEVELKLYRVLVIACENCFHGVAGQCHMPGCLFIRHNIEETPQPLRYLAEILDGEQPTWSESVVMDVTTNVLGSLTGQGVPVTREQVRRALAAAGIKKGEIR